MSAGRSIWDNLFGLVLVLLVIASLLGVFLWYQPVIQENQRMRRDKLELEKKIERETGDGPGIGRRTARLAESGHGGAAGARTPQLRQTGRKRDPIRSAARARTVIVRSGRPTRS